MKAVASHFSRVEKNNRARKCVSDRENEHPTDEYVWRTEHNAPETYQQQTFIDKNANKRWKGPLGWLFDFNTLSNIEWNQIRTPI